jgi:hypothetical protein
MEKLSQIHSFGRLAERTRKRRVTNIVGLPNERRCVSKEHVWRHGNGKNDRNEVLEHYEDQNNTRKKKNTCAGL